MSAKCPKNSKGEDDMPKCNNCGREFEGTFCPDCGTKYQQSKTCPECGAELSGSANFCNYCGHRFETQANTAATPVPVQSKQSAELSDNFYKTVSKLLKWLPCVFFLLFAALNFAFMSCNAYSAFGFNVGNIYKITDADYKVMATVLIVVSSISAAYALAYPLLIGKLPKVSHSVSFVLYIAMLVSASILNINIKKGDWTVDSATKLLIAFAVVFAVLSALALVGDMLLSKRSEKYLQAKTDLKNAPKPVMVQKISSGIKRGYAAHKKAVNGTIIGVCSVAVICVLVFAVIVPVATNIFTSTRLSKLNIGDDKTRVSKVLGTPNSGKEEDNVWTYYGKEFLDLYKQQEKLNKQMENLTDFEQLGKLIEQQAALDEKIRTTVGRQITVSFDKDGLLSSVVYDAAYCKTGHSTAKEVKEITLGKKNTVGVEDIFNGTVNAKVKYKDGSFRLSSLPANVQTSNFGAINKNFPSSATLAWSDGWGEYTQSIKVDESNYGFDWRYDQYDKELRIDGTIPTNTLMTFFDMELPWINNEIVSIQFGTNITYIPALSDLVKDATLITKLDINEYNSNFYGISVETGSNSSTDVIVDKKLNKIVAVPISITVTTDEASNTFVLCESYSDIPVLVLSASSSNKIILPFYNDGNYVIDRNLMEKYNICEFDEHFTIVPERFLFKGNFTEIIIPDSVTTIGVDAFYYCSNLTKVNYLGTIGDWCNISFSDDDANPLSYAHNLYLNDKLVTELIIPYTVKEIKSYAFYNCTSITSVIIPDSVTTIGASAFTGCSNLTSITVSPNNTKYHSAGNCLIEKATKTLILGCSTSVIPTYGSVTSIGEKAFYNCNDLTSITIPNSVTTIGASAFTGCSKLTKVNYLGTIEGWCNISFEYNPLYYADNLYLNDKLVTELIIPDTVKEIKDFTFSNCTSITRITIPDSVTTIGSGALYGCINLREIRYNGTVSEWKAITKGGGWNRKVPATKVICSDGEVTL